MAKKSGKPESILEDEIEKLEKENEFLTSQTIQIVKLCSKMRHLLEQCRSQMLPLSLAKQIDQVLDEAKNYD